MKFSTVAASAVVALAPFASAAPHMKRAPICDLSDLSGLTLTATGDSSGKVRWNIFQEPNFGIQSGTVAFLFQSQPDGPSKFRAIGSTNGPDIFTFQSTFNNQQVLATDNGFEGSDSSGTEFLVTCSQCNTDVVDNQLAANGCKMEITDGNGNGTGKCASWPTGSNVPVEIADCDDTVNQQMGVFAAF
ncbi:hypothetical protein GLOTRDRAFT_136862 [Gloeophyllum trabeum ATCC 11539]|uniref:Uncharacterized protein n=1 Tax=Gloeophyllum trabeum (strain ATCC 11539 / FP-39264 / Madison 617) TaxID=670483 RepID=S7RXJ7_GLOTA|nr:uncharacterized protein GLOTRDRAFT_136862 [Gloeophyllum trabeum ATCC 11539]EPQ58079.1 hypothetical protein GLOTRDRAFT_136862 [Gloeophyllum trabeum ATCC 11539]